MKLKLPKQLPFKLKLPGLGKNAEPALEDLGMEQGWSLRRLLRIWRSWSLWSSVLGFFIFWSIVFSLPSQAIAWRITHEAQRYGQNVSVAEAGINIFGNAVLEDISWVSPPTRPDQAAIPFVVDELEVSYSPIARLLFDEHVLSLDGSMDEGEFEFDLRHSEDESSVSLDLSELPLYAVPKLQQALNAPVRGTFGLAFELSAPEQKYSKTEGTLDISCENCRVGDGETLLFVPGSKGMMAKGVTAPEISLGSLKGHLSVMEGVATAEEFIADSEDLTLKISGDIEFKDKLSDSAFNLVIKLLVKDRLKENSDHIKLMVDTASSKTKMTGEDEGWLGFRLEGTVGRPRFVGINTPTKEDRLRQRREQRAKQAADRKARAAKRNASKKKKKKKKKKGSKSDKDGGLIVDRPTVQVTAARPSRDGEGQGESGDGQDAEEPNTDEDAEEEEVQADESDEEPEVDPNGNESDEEPSDEDGDGDEGGEGGGEGGGESGDEEIAPQ